MAKPSAIDQLNPDDKFWLDTWFKDKGFCGYVEIAEILMERGYSISKSSVHRYGQKLERKLAAVQASTQAAIMIAEASPDDGDARSQAVLSMVQTELFNALVDLQNATDDEDGDINPAYRIKLLANAGKGIANIVTASVSQKKWQVEVRDKAQKAADAVENIVSKGGLSGDTVQMIRKEILGIAE